MNRYPANVLNPFAVLRKNLIVIAGAVTKKRFVGNHYP